MAAAQRPAALTLLLAFCAPVLSCGLGTRVPSRRQEAPLPPAPNQLSGREKAKDGGQEVHADLFLTPPFFVLFCFFLFHRVLLEALLITSA